ncbi:MAG: PAS domain-containing protein [Rhodothermaceae bacterium]
MIEKTQNKPVSQIENIVNGLSVIVYKCLVDLDWTMLYMSDSMKDVTGYKPDDFIGFDSKMTYSSIICEEDRDLVANIIAKAMVKNSNFEMTYSIINAEGKKVPVFEKGRFVKEKQTLIEGIIFPISSLQEEN